MTLKRLPNVFVLCDSFTVNIEIRNMILTENLVLERQNFVIVVFIRTVFDCNFGKTCGFSRKRLSLSIKGQS